MKLLPALLLLFTCLSLAVTQPPKKDPPSLQAGAAKVDISPPDLPAIKNGGFIEATANSVQDPLHSRAVVLADATSKERIALVIVDSCMIPRTMCDAIKKEASEKTGIAQDRILISATHTHSAPSVMHYCLGTRADPNYAKFLPPKVVESIVLANKNVQPAQAAWTVFDASDFTANRRWITRSDRKGVDPFGMRTVRAMMHPGHNNPNYIGESGPEDPDFSLLSLQTRDGKPLAVLGNFSMHYFSGHAGFSADYFGEYAKQLEATLAPDAPSFVGILSQGTSGDIWRADYGKPAQQTDMVTYSRKLVDLSLQALKNLPHRHDLPLKMAESRLTLSRRVPAPERLAWAKELMAKMDGRRPKNRTEVYAEQAVYLHENPREEVVLQAVRIGELGLTAMPNEVYALSGLKLKARSPLETTINFSLANGAAGYIPPPEQHHLGGYNAWPARTAGLEVRAEPKIIDRVLRLLESTSLRKRKDPKEPAGTYRKLVESQGPDNYFSMATMESAPGHELGLAYYLPGMAGPGFAPGFTSRCTAFAGGRIRVKHDKLGGTYAFTCWIWNGLPNDARPVTGYFFSRGGEGAEGVPGDHIGIGGTHSNPGKLILFNGNNQDELIVGKTVLKPRTWYHVALVREQEHALLYLNGELEIAKDLIETHDRTDQLFIGGRSDNFANLEGRLDEAALFRRSLSAKEVKAQYQAGTQTQK